MSGAYEQSSKANQNKARDPMAKEFSLREFEGELVATMEEPEARPQPETPFRIALLGDWSGRANRKLLASPAELAEWRPLLIDRDNLDQIMARLGVKLHLPVTGENNLSLTISFRELDDFHPDRIYRRLDLFERLRQLRDRLQNPKSFAAAAAEVRSLLNLEKSHSQDTSEEPLHEPQDAMTGSPGGLLDQILDQSKSADSKTDRGLPRISAEISALAREAVAPYVVPGPDAQEEELIAAVDRAIGNEMAAILHNSEFQALEAAWRAVYLLVSRLDTGENLKLYLLDISRAELEADLMAVEDLRQTALYKLLVEKTVGTPGGIPWAVVAANYYFDITQADAQLLKRIGEISRAAGAPFVSGATARLIGCESLADSPNPDDWNLEDSDGLTVFRELKGLPIARYLGLTLPRFLLRLPYGKETDPVESFEFEEQPENEKPRHEWYVWGNSSFAAAYLFAEAFAHSGWHLNPGDFQEIEGLPLHIFTRDGVKEIKPCAEALMTTRAAEEIIDQGLMPLISLKDTDVVRLGMFQSLAKSRLAGPWG